MIENRDILVEIPKLEPLCHSAASEWENGTNASQGTPDNLSIDIVMMSFQRVWQCRLL